VNVQYIERHIFSTVKRGDP